MIRQCRATLHLLIIYYLDDFLYYISVSYIVEYLRFATGQRSTLAHIIYRGNTSRPGEVPRWNGGIRK